MSRAGSSPARYDQSARFFFWLVVLALAALATWSNLDLTADRAYLFMDEMIPFDNVKRILTADSWSGFWWAVADGGDHRYGRIFYYISALFSVLPFRWFGDPGLIVGVRSTQVILLLSAYIVLCRSFLRTWPARALAMFCLGCLPFTSYYLTMPKPEPLQLLLLACFLALAAKRRFALGGHWLLLGLAFGAKISVAPLCAAAGIAGLVTAWFDRTPPPVFLRQTLLGLGTFLAGWLLAIPFLAVPSEAHINQYLHWTFRATTHPVDDASVSPVIWLKSLTDQTFAINYYLPRQIALFFVLALTSYFGLQSVALLVSRLKLKEAWSTHGEWILLGFAVTLLIPIIFLVKRVWGLYLHNGETLGLIALVSMGEKAWLGDKAQSGWNCLLRYASVVMTAMTLYACWCAAPKLWSSFSTNATRTSQPTHMHKAGLYQNVQSRLRSFAAAMGHVDDTQGGVRVFYDPALYLPASEPGMAVQPFWNHDINWSLGAEVFVIGYANNMEYYLWIKSLPPPTSGKYLPILKSREQFSENVDLNPLVTAARPYCVAGWLGRDLVIIVRQDLLKAWSASTAHLPPLAPVLPPE